MSKHYAGWILTGLLALLMGCATPKIEEPLPVRATDIEWINDLHEANSKWEPSYQNDEHEGQMTHLVTTDMETILRICGEGKLACTIPYASAEAVAWTNLQVEANLGSEEQKLTVGACVIFMPVRPPWYPKSWFYLLGHEFSHCRYGDFHPEDDVN